MKYCSKCGNKLKENAGFCSNCGSRIEKEKHNIENQPSKKKKLNFLWKGIFIAIGIIIAYVIIMTIILNVNLNKQEIGSIENSANTITLTQNNFNFIEYSYLNKPNHNYFCEKRKTNSDCGFVGNPGPCPEADIFDLSYKLTGVDNSISCKVYDGSQLVKTKVFDNQGRLDHYQEEYYLGGDPAQITLFLDYMYSHDLLVCCQAKGIDTILSNEVCLPRVEVEKSC